MKVPGKAKKSENKMREIRIEKLILNICVGSFYLGESGDKLVKAEKVLKELTGQKPLRGKARYTIRSFGVKRNEEISVYTTVRGKKADEILKRGLKTKDLELKAKNFTSDGNFGFGIEEHIDLGIKYDPAIGIYGMNFFVVLSRPGSRIKHRKHCNSPIGNFQKVKKEDAIKWFKEKLNGTVIGQ